MKLLPILFILFLASGSLMAQRNKKVNGNGNMVTLERTTTDYDQIVISAFFDIELVDGPEGNLTLKGEENILEHITTEVADKKLLIKVKKGYQLRPSSWKKGVVITVPIEHIDALKLSGSGDVVCKTTIRTGELKIVMSGSGDIQLNLDAQMVNASMSGSGDMALSGTTTDLIVKVSGSGDIEAFDLIANNVEALVSGSSNVEVSATKMINAKVSGSGDIDYKGNPEKVTSKISGSGNITQL